MSEFDLIRRYFTRPTPSTVLGVGDDAALVRVGAGMELVVSTDMLVSGTHFFPDADPFLLGHKTLAVNLSDLAAMGARPRWATLALALPEADEEWLQQFSAGFFALAEQQQVELVGGDTTRGSLNLCVTVLGEVPQGAALRRDAARVGDDIWVSGKLGAAALALAHLQGRVQLSTAQFTTCAQALHQPQPRVALGLALRGVAHSAIDISDGLLADLGHVVERSQVGAEIEFAALPLAHALSQYSMRVLGDKDLSFPRRRESSSIKALDSRLRGNDTLGSHLHGNDQMEITLLQHCILGGGDDYELCFIAATAQRRQVAAISAQLDVPLTRIGAIVAGSGCTVRATDGSSMEIGKSGYDHFI